MCKAYVIALKEKEEKKKRGELFLFWKKDNDLKARISMGCARISSKLVLFGRIIINILNFTLFYIYILYFHFFIFIY